MDQGVSWWGVCGLELHSQSTQAAFSGTLKSFTVLQQCTVQMQTDVCLQALWEALQHLQ